MGALFLLVPALMFVMAASAAARWVLLRAPGSRTRADNRARTSTKPAAAGVEEIAAF